MKNAYLKFSRTSKHPDLPNGWNVRTLFKIVGNTVMSLDNGQWIDTKWPNIKSAVDTAKSIGFQLLNANMTDEGLERKAEFISGQDILGMPKAFGSDATDALRYMSASAPWSGKTKVSKECVHEPMEYVGFNTVQTICKKCDKTLA